MIKRFFVIVSILFSVITTAQEGTSSPYSFYGIGLTTFQGTVENRSMGGLSIFADSIHINLRNPASYGKLRLTTYTLGGSHSMINVKNGQEKESSTVSSIDYLALGIPVDRFGFGFGLLPYTSVGYNIIDINEESGIANRYQGSGGLNRVFLSAGYRITDNLTLGAEANYNFGNIENKSILIREGLQYGTREINTSGLKGFKFNFGMIYDRMLSEDLEFIASAHYSPESSLTSDNFRQIALLVYSGEGQEVAIDPREIDVENSELILPEKYAFGAGIGQPRKWFLGAEYVGQGEQSFNNRSFEIEDADFTSSSIYRLGGFFIPEFNSLTSYFSRVVYRGGLRYEETGLSLGGEPINEFGITLGVGLPAGRTFSNVNLGLEYGQRGTTNAGLIKENFFTVFISLSLNDKWFIKRRFE